jgi:hypothetical protein
VDTLSLSHPAGVPPESRPSKCGGAMEARVSQMSGPSAHRYGLPFAIYRYLQAIDFLLALPYDSPAPEAPVPVDPDISDILNVGKSANIDNFHNFSHVNYGLGYVSKLHDFIDGCNYFDNCNFIINQGNEFYCSNVCLDSDFVKLNLNFIGNDLHVDNSLARERLCCKYVHIFNINYSKNKFACGLDFYFNKYWGNISQVNFSSSFIVDTSFYQTVCQFYFSDSCSNIVSILARSMSLLRFDLDLYQCCLAGC